MICEKILGNVKEKDCSNYIIDYVDIEWFDAFKKLHKKTSNLGNEIGIRLNNDTLIEGIDDGSILYEDKKMLIVVNIPETDMIKIRSIEKHEHLLYKVCYEVGNRHGALLWGDNYNEVMTPYTETMLELLKKIHGIQIEIIKTKIDFNKRISASLNSHTH